MTTAVKDEAKAGEGAAVTEQAKPAAETPAKPEAPAKPDAKAGAKAEDAKGGKAGDAPAKDPKQPVALKDEDDIPEDAELVTLSSAALKKRLQRASNAELKERFGTTDTAAIKKKLDRADELEKAEEDRRVAALDKEQKAAEAQKKAEDRPEAAELKLKQLGEDRLVEKEEGRIKEIAFGHIKPKFWKHAARDFAEHLRETYSEKELLSLKDKAIDKWFVEYVKENPEYLKGEAPEKPGAKTFKPGQPNSMTSAEARAEAAKSGHRW